MKYTEIMSNRSGTTADFRGEDGSLVEVYEYKSGKLSFTPIPEVSAALTERVRPESARTFEYAPIRQYVETDREAGRYRETYCNDCVRLIYCQANNKFCNKVVVELAEDKYREGYEATHHEG